MENAFFYNVYQLGEVREETFADFAETAGICYRYFRADTDTEMKHYIFGYSSCDIDFEMVNSILVPIQNLDRRQRKIRSLRGYILYADEIYKTAKTKEVLQTNMKHFLWEEALYAIRQNRTKGLEAVMYGESRINSHPYNGTAIIRRPTEAPTISQKTGKKRFKKVTDISNDTLEMIISEGFKLQEEQKISSMKNYFESTDDNCVFNTHGYFVKYETIRRTALFKAIREAQKNS